MANAVEAGDFARKQVSGLVREARDATEPALHQALDFARHEGDALVEAMGTQLKRAGRAVKADPVPALVGAIGVALLASLLLARRRR